MGNSETTRTPAIVLAQGANALGVLRSLQMAGVPAYVACPPDDLVTRSRWYRPTPGARPWDGTLGATGLQALRDMPLEQAVLIPGADDAALWLADLPQHELAARFRVSSSSRETQELLQDKSRFAQFLGETDIPHPPTFHIASAADIEAIPFARLDRLFIKPVNSQQFSDILGVKGVRVSGRDELLRVWQQLQAHGFGLMAQEYVPGGADDHYFVDGFRDAGGRLTGLFARRRYRIHPIDFGNSSYCQSIPLAAVEAPVRDLSKLLAQVNYRGIFSAEFKRDARDGQYRILEVNSRAWTYVEFASRCGVNVCEMAWHDALGLPVTAAPAIYPVGAGCVNLPRDIRSLREQPPGARAPALAVMRQWAKAHFHAFRLDDPLPGLVVAADIVAMQWRRMLRHLRAMRGRGPEASPLDKAPSDSS
ncbi:hypothetical protein [Dyella sp.]|jgi:predicted ATP-grasp superfamily ATP-dependent carboligase|uniref:carboxylate--amine ligase n=1 Tax=Dyella sp. TaxID=1869338 RepID=UPI002D79FBDF|nr:hypothetical protein [Dyella sp.]HET6431627.1 hypothetical protein [Dyella sp.]